MHVIRSRNVHHALPEGLRHLLLHGERRESRNGPVLVAPGPVATVYESPMEKCEFWPLRDSNPTFHCLESLWMLGGRNDVAFPAMFNSRIQQYSDEGLTFHGAYGHRWRHHFEMDQLKIVAEALKKNPDDRRQVIQMWDCRVDLGREGKDLPCNDLIFCTRRPSGELDITVCCRSNDIVFGCYGANAVHFAFLLEYLAAMVGCLPGRYVQFSNNWHGYLKTVDPIRALADEAPMSDGNSGREVRWDPYRDQVVKPYPLIHPGETVKQFDQDLQMFLDLGGDVALNMRSGFLRSVAAPLARAYRLFQDRENPDRHLAAMAEAEKCCAEDWANAALLWYQRRQEKQRKLEEAEPKEVEE